MEASASETGIEAHSARQAMSAHVLEDSVDLRQGSNFDERLKMDFSAVDEAKHFWVSLGRTPPGAKQGCIESHEVRKAQRGLLGGEAHLHHGAGTANQGERLLLRRGHAGALEDLERPAIDPKTSRQSLDLFFHFSSLATLRRHRRVRSTARYQRQSLIADVQGNDFGAASGTDLNHETSHAPGAQHDRQISRSDVGTASRLEG